MALRKTKKPDAEWLEVPVLIHGITTAAYPTSHGPAYAAFLARVNGALAAAGKRPFDEPAITVEWGWEDSLGRDRDLAAAERALAAGTFAAVGRRAGLARVWDRVPDAGRRAFIYGFADLSYYISADGEKAVRENVYRCLSQQLEAWEERQGGRAARVSLTFFAHSAGAVVAHDFLYKLFSPRGGGPFGLWLNAPRRLVRRGRLRVRRFYTLGAPIPPLVLRADALIAKAIAGERLEPAHIGLREEDGLGNPRWVNFWNRRDVFSYPVAFLYRGDGAGAPLQDRCVELKGNFPDVHRRYWESDAVARAIAETF